MATSKAPDLKSLLTERITAPGTGILPGWLKDEFTLTVEKWQVKGKGSICALSPLFWGVPFLDFNNNKNSKLYIFIDNVKDRKVKLTFQLFSVSGGQSGQGKLNINFEENTNSTSNTGQITMPLSTPGPSLYTVTSRKFSANNIMVGISSSDFQDWCFMEVKVQIFEPYF
jgi:hypothetical protein